MAAVALAAKGAVEGEDIPGAWDEEGRDEVEEEDA